MVYKPAIAEISQKKGFKSIQNGYGNYFVNRNRNDVRSVLDVNLYFLVLVDIGSIVLRERTFNNLPVDAQDADPVPP